MPKAVTVALEGANCPQCAGIATLQVRSRLVAHKGPERVITGSGETTSMLTATWQPVLLCDDCSLVVVGRYSANGNHALFDFGGDDGQAESQAAQQPAG